ncbi:MAG: hypothetical protein LBR36_09575 [Bacteroidales bacterium]|jgi:predicted transcriptional regulator|nr:hypothetical protein [Bacteroidales bacterium]
MRIKDVELEVQGDTAFYIAYGKVKEKKGNKIILDLSEKEKNNKSGIAFVGMEKKYYYPVSFKVGKTQINLFICKGEIKEFTDKKDILKFR